MENFELLPTSELEKKAKELTDKFDEYKPILADILNEMDELSKQYNEIMDIIKRRNGGQK